MAEGQGISTKIYFVKESNGNITIRNAFSNTIIYALQPSQNLSKDIVSPNNIIIKTAIANDQDREIVINVLDIDEQRCIPSLSPGEKNNSENENDSSITDFYIKELSRYFFFVAQSVNNVTNPVSSVRIMRSVYHIPFVRRIAPMLAVSGDYFFSYNAGIILTDCLSNLSGEISLFDNINYNNSNTLFFCASNTKLLTYTGSASHLGYELVIVRARIEEYGNYYNFAQKTILASIPLQTIFHRIDLTQYIREPIYENEVVIVTYKKLISGLVENNCTFNGTFTLESEFPSNDWQDVLEQQQAG